MVCLLATLSFLCALVASPIASPSFAEEKSQSTLGDGLILIAPLGEREVYLMNSDKQVVQSWQCDNIPGNATYFLEDGSLLRMGRTQTTVFNARGGSGGHLQKISWDGDVLWEYFISSNAMMAHHDIAPMPNGNVLVIAWENRTREEAIQAGRDPRTLTGDSLWPETILELKPNGPDDATIVWQWRMWDHLIQKFNADRDNYGDYSKHHELIDINYGTRRGQADWIHMNSIDYNPELDQIALSARWFDEAWIIDHSTTTEEAAGHSGGRYGRGGDLLYRWGNADSYFGALPFERQLYAQHHIHWIKPGLPGAGNLLVFNNGDRRGNRMFSSVDEIKPPINENGSYRFGPGTAYGPAEPTWTYSDKPEFASDRISGAQRLPSGNTLVCSGDQAWVFEVTPDGERVWEFRLRELTPNSLGKPGLFRAPYIPADHPGLANRELTPDSVAPKE